MNEKRVILVIEDEHTISNFICRALSANDYKPIPAFAGKEGLSLYFSHGPDLVLLDLGLPDMDGIEVLQELSGLPQETPVIIISARDRESEKVKALDMGADDYVVKPFNIRELLLRIRAILRRQVMVESNPVLTRHGVSVDPAAHKVTVLGHEVELTATEFRLIEDLLRNAGRVRTREELLAAVWGYQFEGYARTVDTHIRRLRNKLGDAAEIIETVRGVGYRCKE